MQVARDRLTPWHRARPGIITLPLKAEILPATNLISRTPGTLSHDVTEDCRMPVMHAVFADESGAIARRIGTAGNAECAWRRNDPGETPMDPTLTDRMTILAFRVQVAFAKVMAGVLLAMLRLTSRPSLPGRVVAFDTMRVSIVVISGPLAIETGNTVFLDVAVALALICSLDMVAFARSLERKANRPPPDRLPCSRGTAP